MNTLSYKRRDSIYLSQGHKANMLSKNLFTAFGMTQKLLRAFITKCNVLIHLAFTITEIFALFV